MYRTFLFAENQSQQIYYNVRRNGRPPFFFFFSILRHANILLLMAVYDSVDPLRRELVLEPVERGFLRKLFLEDKSVFDEDTVLRFSQDVVCAMQFVHQRGYIHCYLGSPSVVFNKGSFSRLLIVCG